MEFENVVIMLVYSTKTMLIFSSMCWFGTACRQLSCNGNMIPRFDEFLLIPNLSHPLLAAVIQMCVV